jgi:hypothetical protein
VEWTAEESCSWISVSPSKHSGDGTISVSYEENTGKNTRFCNIILSGEGKSNQCLIMQKGKE